ncbi:MULTISPECIES: lipase family protein [Roseobacteraceae]|uniref:lipase family protein n=1 Tax=Roseobacteraceae TaxID=2854170 RepID=UPI001C45CA88|nr:MULTISPECIES: lipase family protein [Roseobacteraceae]MBV7408907.1 lipase family protein [Maritimibacter sp. DP1N21-5]MBY5934406.1 lipase family protein [Tateyamaria omphalii]
MTHRYDIARAAQMVEASYLLFKRRPPRTSLDASVKDKLDKNHVQAVFLKQNILLIPGSNSVGDYVKFNLRVLNFGGKKYRLNDELTDKWGAHDVIWHQGFMRHAKVIADWMQVKRYRPKYIIGHSLGAAATQILVRTHDVPGIAFAAPRVTRGIVQPAPASKCLCLNRNDDKVCDLPGSFQHLGEVHAGEGERRFLRFDHQMDRYQEMVTAQQAAGHLGTHWPA